MKNFILSSSSLIRFSKKKKVFKKIFLLTIFFSFCVYVFLLSLHCLFSPLHLFFCQPMCCGLFRGFWLLEKSCMIHIHYIFTHI
jgi:hypothetical protein